MGVAPRALLLAACLCASAAASVADRGQESLRKGTAGSVRGSSVDSQRRGTVDSLQQGTADALEYGTVERAEAETRTDLELLRSVSAELNTEVAFSGETIQVDSEMSAMVLSLLKRHGADPPTRQEMLHLGLKKVHVAAAARRIESKLPTAVASLVHVAVEDTDHAPESQFDEASLAKARKYLNLMIEKGWRDLDDVLISCKEFEDRNRGTFEQVMSDLARLGEQVADLERVRAETVEYINTKENEITGIIEQMNHEKEEYAKEYWKNKMEMQIRKNDLAVFLFMMQLTKCKGAAASFVQAGAKKFSPSDLKICEGPHGLQLRMDDAETHAKLERMLTPKTRGALTDVLSRVRAAGARDAAVLLQQEAVTVQKQDDDEDDGDDSQVNVMSSLGIVSEATTTTTTTSYGLPTPPVKKDRVLKRVSARAGGVKCPAKPPDCGLLHDSMSLMWGKYKDLVDELQATMDQNEAEHNHFITILNQQLDVLRTSKARFTMELNEAVSSMNSAREDIAEKTEVRRELEHTYKKHMHACTKRIEWVFYQDICAYIQVRSSLMSYSSVSPPNKITDCDFSNWIPTDCSVMCDDTCPHKDNPYTCGGWQTMNRGVIAQPNEYGAKCPPLVRKRKCNQIKCPVNCKMSRWSGWGKCSKDCEGGVQGRTRSILVKPRNGGMACNTVQESRPCHTGSCDRNCALKKWSKWTPCSVACGGGFQERVRRVLVPIRGEGKCPKVQSKYRLQLQKCNTHECRGDEVCISKMDLVMAIDSSGSLQQKGFDTIKGFCSKLIDRYYGKYYGFEDMRIGVVEFGNGEVKEDGTVSEAKLITEMSADMTKVKAAINGMTYQKGFTNMAQAFTAAEKLFLLNGRVTAQSAIMTITDGKPSFLYQTNEKVQQLKDKHVKLFFAPVTEFKGEELKLMKKWASWPWYDSLVHIPGTAALEADEIIFVEKALVKFCPEAMSPSATAIEEKEFGFMLIHEDAHCGERAQLLAEKVNEAADCAALASKAGLKAFSLGTHYARGKCWGEKLEVDEGALTAFKNNRIDPPCPGGEWKNDELYDFYVLMPVFVDGVTA